MKQHLLQCLTLIQFRNQRNYHKKRKKRKKEKEKKKERTLQL